MADSKKVGVLVGSLRKDSYSLKLAKALLRVAPASLQMTQIEIGDMPHYNEDLDTDTPPESWVRFRREMGAQDAVLFVSPEYNRSLPSALKNAIDVGSRPYGVAIMASDTMDGEAYAGMKNVWLSLTYESIDTARAVFETLASGGNVVMPFSATFWSPGFGMVIDRFGTHWMLNI